MVPATGRLENPSNPVVLVVEDEILIRWSIAQVLRAAGWTVIEANSAAEALSILLAKTQVSVIFTDVQMPGPLNGLQLVERVQVEFPGIRCVITSSERPSEALLRGYSFIAKPCDLDDLDRLLRGELSGDD